MKKVFKLILLFALFAIPEIANASCDSNELYRLKKLASNVSYKYDYTEKFLKDGYSEVTFEITVTNVFDSLYVKFVEDGTNLENKIVLNKVNNEVKINNLKPGTTHRFEVYASSSTGCVDERLFSFYVNLPSFNKFYSDELCKNSSENKYCKKWTNLVISEEEFKKTLKEYNESKISNEDEEEYKPTKRKYEDLENIILFLNQYVFYVCIPLIIICIIGISYLKNKDNYNLKV